LKDKLFIRVFLLVITGIFAGYTLQPVPTWLNNWFNTSVIFKFIVLVLIGAVALHPLDVNKLRMVLIVSAIILAVFFFARLADIVKTPL